MFGARDTVQSARSASEMINAIVHAVIQIHVFEVIFHSIEVFHCEAKWWHERSDS